MFNGLNVGSIIIDSDNKPGTRNLSILAFCYDENEKPLAGNKKEQAISIASSNNGINWIFEKDNKVSVDNAPEMINDIKVFRHDGTQRYIMAVISIYDFRIYLSD